MFHGQEFIYLGNVNNTITLQINKGQISCARCLETFGWCHQVLSINHTTGLKHSPSGALQCPNSGILFPNYWQPQSVHEGSLHKQFEANVHCPFKNISSILTWPGGWGTLCLLVLLPRHALITVLCRWRWISASNWFQSLSCSGPRRSLPNSCICCILEWKRRIGFKNIFLVHMLRCKKYRFPILPSICSKSIYSQKTFNSCNGDWKYFAWSQKCT